MKNNKINKLSTLRRTSVLHFRSVLNPVLFYKSILRNDKWVIRSIYNGKRNGFFVEAGAFSGVFNSSCYTLEKHFGWTGICVEPHSKMYPKCVKNRPGSIVENVALSDKPGTAQFVETAKVGYSGLLRELQNAEETALKEGWTKDEWRTGGDFVERQVNVVTLQELLEKNNAPEIIDYIAMDIEGSEETVLRNFPFDSYQVGCLSIEGDYCNDLLRSRGFLKVKNPFNRVAPWETYFVNRAIADDLNLSDALEAQS